MRLTWTKLPLAGLLLSATVVLGQPPTQNPGKAPAQPKAPAAPAKPDPNSLEGLIADALKSHPDIRVAEAKVRDADAQLNQTRFQVIQQVTVAYSKIKAEKATLGIVEIVLAKHKDLFKRSVISDLEVQKAELDVDRARASLAQLEADLSLLVGRSNAQYQLALTHQLVLPQALTFSPDGRWLAAPHRDGTVRVWDGSSSYAIVGFASDGKVAAGSMSEKIRAALQKTVKIDGRMEAKPVADVIEYLKEKAGTDVPFRIVVPSAAGGSVDLMAGDLPLSAWLSMIEDSMPTVVFVVREYGILMTGRDRVPEGAVRLREFLRSTEPKKDETKKQ